ncbi:MAG TPA: VWA domain-containing protein [Candidatus Solibacter sp.]|nr:VWA domain-containing protein [Candidatus Solibacter sp.]
MRIAVLILGTMAAALAQDKPGAVIRIDVNLVQVDAVVTDSHGKHVTDLKASDFEILQDGKPQTITNFSYHSSPVVRRANTTPARGAGPVQDTIDPAAVRRTVVIVIDNLGMAFENLVRSRNAVRKFIDEQMQAGDLSAIMRTTGGMGALQRFTTDPRLLRAALDRVNYSILGRPEIKVSTVALSSDPSAQLEQRRTELFSVGTLGAIRAVVSGMREMPGRKSLILFSENLALFNAPNHADFNDLKGPLPDNGGTAMGMAEALERLVDAANRASVVVHTIDPRGLIADPLPPHTNPAEPSPSQKEFEALWNSRSGLVELAHQTGGLFLANNNEIAELLQRAIDDSDGYYLLGYHPDADTFKSGGADHIRKLRVRVTRPGLQVRSRVGFFGAPDSIDGDAARRLPATPQLQLLSAVNSPFSGGAIHVRLTPLFVDSPTTGPSLNAMLYIDTRDLDFAPEVEGSRKASFDLLAVTYDARGQAATTANRHYTITAPANTFESERNRGLLYTTSLAIKSAGIYQVRVALRDARSGQIGSATQIIEVPNVKKGHLELSSLILKDVAAAADIQGSAAVRTFRPGATIEYGYQILNAKSAAGKSPEVESQVLLLRDGKTVLTGAVKPIDAANQTNTKPFGTAGQLRLSSNIAPGDYVLQVVVTDKRAPEKFRTTTQWIDFEVR